MLHFLIVADQDSNPRPCGNSRYQTVNRDFNRKVNLILEICHAEVGCVGANDADITAKLYAHDTVQPTPF